jgi:hypothetical protein
MFLSKWMTRHYLWLLVRFHELLLDPPASESWTDTGSSDLWVISDNSGLTPPSGVSLYPHDDFISSGIDVHLVYGDSHTGTHADGLIGKANVSLAGLMLQNQYFVAINKTNTSVLETGSVGIFGLGFPINRYAFLRMETQKSP